CDTELGDDVRAAAWPAAATAATALRMTSVTTWGCDIMITWEPPISVMVALARSAIQRTTSLPAAWSPVATTAQEGKLFQVGRPDGSENASSATGRWVAAITAACSADRSAAKASWSLAGSIANSTALAPPSANAPCTSTTVVGAAAALV